MPYHHCCSNFCFGICHQEKQEGLKLSGTHQLFASADDVNIVGENIGTIQKNLEALLGVSRVVGLEQWHN
jgi:hypothetical protein